MHTHPSPPLPPAALRSSFFASKFEELQSGLFAANPKVFPSAVFTADNFLWAVVAVRRWEGRGRWRG